MPALVTASDLVKRYGDVKALRGLSVEVGRGIWGLVGPNGAGKTTFIKLVLGLLRPDGGELRAFGLDCWRDSMEVRRRVGVLHERPSYPGKMEVGRYLELVARMYGVPDPGRAAAGALGEVGLSEHAGRKISSLSAGMLKRLGLAQAMVHRPELVILDEPTANLDVIGRMEFLHRVEEMRKEGKSFLISSHVLSEVQSVCDHVAVIYGGRVLESGSLGEVMAEASGGVWLLEASDPGRLARALVEAGYEASAEGRVVRVASRDPTRLALDAASACLREGLELTSMRPELPSLEETFRRLISREVPGPDRD